MAGDRGGANEDKESSCTDWATCGVFGVLFCSVPGAGGRFFEGTCANFTIFFPALLLYFPFSSILLVVASDDVTAKSSKGRIIAVLRNMFIFMIFPFHAGFFEMNT